MSPSERSEGRFLVLARTVDPTASIATTPLDEDDPHEAKLWFRAPDETGHHTYVYEVRFIEVFWAQAFEAPGVGEFLKWTGQILWGHLQRIVGKRARFFSGLRYWGLAVWQRAAAELLILPLIALAIALIIIARVSQFVVPKDRLPAVISTPQRVVIQAATRHLGDMWVYMRASWEASRIRVRFEERFRQAIRLLDDSGENNPAARVDSIFVIAHSMGSVVAYEALTGRRMTELLSDRFTDPTGPEIHFISAGSALNWAWDIAPQGERFRFHRQLHPSVKWLNLWSGPDPVARGPLDGPRCERGDPDWDRGRWDPSGKQRVADADCPVINQSDIFSDHSAYWNNAEEVIAPILDRITNGAMSGSLQLNVKARRVRVQVLALAKLLALFVAPGIFLWAASTGIDGWLLDRVLDDPFGVNPDWLQRDFLSPLVVSVALGILGAVAYSSIVKWLWDLWDRRVKYKPPPDER